MGSFIGTVLGVAFIYLLCLAASTMVLVFARWLLICLFESLGQGFSRKVIAYPVVALLGRERRAIRGDDRSLYQLVLIMLAITAVVSWIFQGFLSAMICTGVAAGASALAVFKSE